MPGTTACWRRNPSTDAQKAPTAAGATWGSDVTDLLHVSQARQRQTRVSDAGKHDERGMIEQFGLSWSLIIQRADVDVKPHNDLVLELGYGSLVCKTQSHLRMLQHVVKAQILDSIIRSMNLLVTVFEVTLDDKS